MPVYDFKSVDESKNEFNWGYDPQNYNVPEGSYSTDPSNGCSRVIEFKRTVQSLHSDGIGVIMDVVYNHTYESNSNLNKVVTFKLCLVVLVVTMTQSLREKCLVNTS